MSKKNTKTKTKSDSVKVDFTHSGGLDDKLLKIIVSFCDQFEPVLLCKEGDGKDVHIHAHAVIGTKSRADNFKRKIKTLYQDNGYEWTRYSVKVKPICEIKGALSYVYKDKLVLLVKSYDLSQILPWVKFEKEKKDKKSEYFVLNNGNAVYRIISYADKMGVRINDLQTFKQIVCSMSQDKYRFTIILKNIRPIFITVMAHYGNTSHLEAFLDEKCNYLA